MTVLSIPGLRWFLILCLALSGILYLTLLSGWSQISYGVLPGNPVVYSVIAGLFLIGASLLILIRRGEKMVSLSVAFLLTLFAAGVYAPCLGSSDGGLQVSSMINLLRDMALAGGSLAYAGLAPGKL